MDELKIFNSSEFGEVRIIQDASKEPTFRLSDICRILSLRTSDVRSRLDDDVVSTHPIQDRLGRTQQVTFVNEDGLYDVILDSRKLIAKKFRKWVTSEVLPSIRKSGGYMVAKQDETPEAIMARALKIADETLARNNRRLRELEATTEIQAQTIGAQERELKVAAPKVKFYDDTLASVDFLTISQIANELGINADTLNKKLAECGIQHKQGKAWLLNKPYKEWNLHGTRTYGFLHSDGSNGTTTYTVWNQRGRRLIHALYNNDFNVKTALAEIKGELTKESTNNKNK